MKFFLFLLFFIPSLTNAFNIVQASSTHALGFDIELVDFAPASEIRVFYGTPASYTRINACSVYSFNSFIAGSALNDLYIHIRPSILRNSNQVAVNNTTNYVNYYNCSTRGTYTVGVFNNVSATSPISSDTIYLEQMPLDFKQVFMLLFLIGALLAILRPLISKLTLR